MKFPLKIQLNFALFTAEDGSKLSTIRNYLVKQSSLENHNIWNENTARCVYEHSKYLYVNNKKSEAIEFAANALLGINNRLQASDELKTPKLKERCVKFQLKLSEWIQMENEKILEADSLKSVLQIFENQNEIKQPSMMSANEFFIGKLVQDGVQKCPELGKSWSALGNWCYKWGKKMVESKTDSEGLRPIDLASIKQLIPAASDEDARKIVNILNLQHIGKEEDEDIGNTESNSTELIECQLKEIPLLKNITEGQLREIIQLWKQAHRAVYKYYEMSADSYFKFLQLSCSNSTESEDSSVVTATLRLLRLIVKHALGLQEVLEEGLARTPSQPWKVIIPQLFSRLSHHEPYVRRRVSELLCRVAKDAPHLIIFPSVVGAAQGKTTNLDISGNIEDLEEPKESSLSSCFSSLLDTLSQESPETVQQVQLFVRELRRITILWDEKWLLSLQQVYGEYAKRFNSFESEYQKLSEKSAEKITLFAEKYRLLMRPVVYVMERLNDFTSRKPETNNERNFQERLGRSIALLIEDLRKPFNSVAPMESWQKFKQFYLVMQQRVSKRMSYSLKMTDISPILANMRNTMISMPGNEPGTQNEAVYIK